MKGIIFPRPSIKDPKTGVKRPVKGSTWTYAFSVDVAGGKRRQISKGGYRTKADAEEALSIALVAHGQGATVKVEPSKQALAVFLREWLDGRTHLKPSTRAGYSNAIENWIAPHVGDVRLCDLKPEAITKLYRRLRESGGRSQKDRSVRTPLAENSVHKVHVVLTAALAYATQTGRLRVDPMTLIPKSDRPKQGSARHEEMRTWAAAEAVTFLEATAGDRYAPIFDLALNTGMRRGELAGLRWDDVDLDAGTVAVRRNRVPVNWRVEEGTPKSRKARVVDVDLDTVAMLRRWRRRQLEERLKWGEAWTDSGYVFTREDGEPLHPETANWHFDRLQRATNKATVTAHGDRVGKPAVLPTLNLHGLRHTHATLGLAAGVPPKVMQERLGHASVQITIDLYSHVIPGMGADAAAKIGGLLRRTV